MLFMFVSCIYNLRKQSHFLRGCFNGHLSNIFSSMIYVLNRQKTTFSFALYTNDWLALCHLGAWSNNSIIIISQYEPFSVAATAFPYHYEGNINCAVWWLKKNSSPPCMFGLVLEVLFSLLLMVNLQYQGSASAVAKQKDLNFLFHFRFIVHELKNASFVFL